MPKHTHRDKTVLPTVAAITALSSCIMLGAVGAYRLTSGATKQGSNSPQTEIRTEDNSEESFSNSELSS